MAVGRFSQQHLDFWAAHCRDAWVLKTMSQGYRLQFHCQPPPPSGVRVTTVADPVKAQCLSKEIATLLEKKMLSIWYTHVHRMIDDVLFNLFSDTKEKRFPKAYIRLNIHLKVLIF